MARSSEPTVIKKYANRRLYNTGTSTYVTLEDLAVMVKGGEDFVVFDAKSGDDITRAVLTQIICEQEAKGQSLLPVTFLRQLIRFYGDQMQSLVPAVLEEAIGSLTREHGRLRERFAQPVVASPDGQRRGDGLDDGSRVFYAGADARARNGVNHRFDGAEPPHGGTDDLHALKQQLDAMQRKLDQLVPGP